MKVTTGKIQKPQKVVVYGVEGIGKSTFAAQFPRPIFIDTEGSTGHLDVARLDAPESWEKLIQQVSWVIAQKDYDTLVIDTIDWAEKLAAESVCQRHNLRGIEDLGYGKGYVYLEEEFKKFLDMLSNVISSGKNVVLTAHSIIKKFEQPDEIGAYDRYELKLQKKTAPLVKEWADMLLFANYKTEVVNIDNQGAQKGKNKAMGGRRVIYTTHRPAWDAKNRHGLDDMIPMEYAAIATHIPGGLPHNKVDQKQESQPGDVPMDADFPQKIKKDQKPIDRLAELMARDAIPQNLLQRVVAANGYYPETTPITSYPDDFIMQGLIKWWDQVKDQANKLLEQK